MGWSGGNAFGELKHNDKHIPYNAQLQALNYLLCHMYWLTTEEGLLVESVFGFAFCGPKCKGVGSKEEPKYSVHFIELQAPKHLGQWYTAKLCEEECIASMTRRA